jgi:hypothetical protein
MLMNALTNVSPARYMNPAAELTPSMMLRVIAEDLDDEFNSHEFIAALRRRFPQGYAEELIQKASAADPQKAADSAIASRLNFAPFDRAIVNIGSEWAPNVRGTLSRVALWAKKV